MSKSIIIIAMMLFISSSAVAISGPWWLTVEYEPIDLQIEGIPLEKIDSSWSRVFVLDWNNCCRVNQPQLKHLLDDLSNIENPSFSWQGDFNGDGKEDKILIGVFRNKTNKHGQFLLVLTKNKNNQWIKDYLFTTFGKPDFSILSPDKKNKHMLYWAFCVYYCDDYVVLRWDNGQYRIY